ncbi:ferulic acid esterase [Ophiostoma piceae UAMH 11346]|uniref:feruloyl esterase n=1 Tax=Ophiostoma piceae (strain UAMH 11346) TaxID=1262450 RepID=S3CDM6_OPHP1|nr:ferulic acid esterase [Ophiostoma piceae UAMH 11346]
MVSTTVFRALARALSILSATPQGYAAAVPPHSGCGKPLSYGQSPSSFHNVTIWSGNLERRFVVFIPPAYDTLRPSQLIVSFHGGTKTAEEQISLDSLTSDDFNAQSIVIYPQGYNNTWQGTPGRITNDVLFTSDILDYVEATYCIDPKRIMSTGKSQGAGVCNLLACDATLSQRIAAYAPVSGAYYVDSIPCYPDTVAFPCSPGRSDIPILAFHGGNDTVISYNGGDRKGQCLPSIPHWIQAWASRDGLDVSRNRSTLIATNATKYSFGPPSSRCENPGKFSYVNLVYDSDIGHDWPSTTPNDDNQKPYHYVASFNATPIILDFFKHYPLP